MQVSEDISRAPTDAYKDDTGNVPFLINTSNTQSCQKGHGTASQQQQSQYSPAVLARIPGLQRLPELTLDEVAHAQECYAAIIGERKECISNTFELRVLLGQLGLYPSEQELALVVKAARQRVNFTALTRYLRFCKREFEIGLVAGGGGGDGSAGQRPRGAANNQPNSGKNNAAAANGGYAAAAQLAFGGGRGALPGDADTLRAFVSLGGNEDGSGEVSTALLTDVVRNFQLTIDMAGMISSVDVNQSGSLDYTEFCQLWAIPDDQLRHDSLHSLSAHASDDARAYGYNNTSSGPNGAGISGASGGATSARNWNAMTASHRQMVASIGSVRNSVTPGGTAGGQHPLPLFSRGGNPASRRRSSALASPNFGLTPAGKQRLDHYNHQQASEKATAATAALQPLNEEERLQLLRLYLLPEPQEVGQRRARLAIPSSRSTNTGMPHGTGSGMGGNSGEGGADSGNASRLPPIHGTKGVGSSSTRQRGSVKSLRTRKERGGGGGVGEATAEDVFSLQKQGNGAYQPPSPMILFQRRRAGRRVGQADDYSATAAAAPRKGVATGYAASSTPSVRTGLNRDRKNETY